MTFDIAPLPRLCAVAAFALALGAGGSVRAGESSLSQSVTSAFETVVIEAATAAATATAVAKDAVTPAERKKNRTKKSRKTGDGDKAAKAGKSEKSDTSADTRAKGTRDGKTKGTAAETGHSTADKGGKGQGKDGQSAADTKPGDAKPGDVKPADAAPKKPLVATEWPAVDVELARARCTQLLKGIDAVTMPEPPFRKGDCGTLAPVRLISIGKNPEVALSPPPVVTCDMVVALTKWMKSDVQPAARRHLGSEVIRMESMSDYSCRMAYGRIGNKLSEHGKANALDIRGFTTRKGAQAEVLSGWGDTQRDVVKRIAVAKAAAAKAEAVKVAAEQASKERAEQAEFAAKAETTGTPLPRKTLVEGLPPRKDREPSLALPAAVSGEGGLGMAPTHLGGPKEAVARGKAEPDGKKKRKDAAKQKKGAKADGTVAALPPPGADEAGKPQPKTPTSHFLHEVHAAGCRIFGTTLGPEANEAHRNHFHVDMAERKVRKICD